MRVEASLPERRAGERGGEKDEREEERGGRGGEGEREDGRGRERMGEGEGEVRWKGGKKGRKREGLNTVSVLYHMT